MTNKKKSESLAVSAGLFFSKIELIIFDDLLNKKSAAEFINQLVRQPADSSRSEKNSHSIKLKIPRYYPG